MIVINSFRYDCLLAEWNRNILVFKVFYYIKEDIKSKHGLTPENHKKFSILVKFLYVTCIKICIPFSITFTYLYYFYVAIMSDKIVVQMLTC